eukprot:365804-Chlamydomonas_euryale.AAC.2
MHSPCHPRTVPKEARESRVKTLTGVGRHLELAALARRRKEEQAKVQAKVWWQQPKGNDQLFTVPQPFQFHRPTADDNGMEHPRAGRDVHM